MLWTMWAIISGVAWLTLQSAISWLSKPLGLGHSAKPQVALHRRTNACLLGFMSFQVGIVNLQAPRTKKRNATSFFLLSVFSTGQQSQSPHVWGCIAMGDCSLHFIGGWGRSDWQVHKRFGEYNLPLACFQERCTLDSTFCSESETTCCVWLCWPWTKSLKFK